MRVLATSVKGRLGHDVMSELTLRGIEGIGVDMEEMDITDRIVCEIVISREKPDTVIHCAAYTAVDTAEDSLELCHKINTEGTHSITRVYKAMDVKMMYASTDHVFNGGGQQPWEPDDHREPLNVYGLTKCEGKIAVEQNIQRYFIVHIARVSGVDGKNFTKTMLRLGKEERAISVVSDQIGSPTCTYDLARLLVDMIQTDEYGRYHATDEGLCSWYEFAYEIFRQAGMGEVRVIPVDSDSFPAEAKRPSNSRMSKEELTENGFERPPSWQDTLGHYLEALEENEMT